jgi:hypothetical protein
MKRTKSIAPPLRKPEKLPIFVFNTRRGIYLVADGHTAF